MIRDSAPNTRERTSSALYRPRGSRLEGLELTYSPTLPAIFTNALGASDFWARSREDDT